MFVVIAGYMTVLPPLPGLTRHDMSHFNLFAKIITIMAQWWQSHVGRVSRCWEGKKRRKSEWKVFSFSFSTTENMFQTFFYHQIMCWVIKFSNSTPRWKKFTLPVPLYICHNHHDMADSCRTESHDAVENHKKIIFRLIYLSFIICTAFIFWGKVLTTSGGWSKGDGDKREYKSMEVSE